MVTRADFSMTGAANSILAAPERSWAQLAWTFSPTFAGKGAEHVSRGGQWQRAESGPQPGRPGADGDLLLLRAGHRVRAQARGQVVAGFLPVRAVIARMGYRDRLHLSQYRRGRAPRAVGQRRPVRRGDGALLLDRRHSGHGVPRHRHDAVLLRLQGA